LFVFFLLQTIFFFPKFKTMNGTGQSAIPNALVSTDEEKRKVWYIYGQRAERAGFRAYANPPPVVAHEMQHSQCGELLAAASASKDTAKQQEYANRCGPFRTDYYTNPLYVEGRDTKITDMPPR
jgi:hypothetical protein